jgi:hypothetical protein
MNTDKEPADLQGGGNKNLLFKEETHAVIGCAFEVLNELGHGLNENLNFKHPRLEWERIVL